MDDRPSTPVGGAGPRSHELRFDSAYHPGRGIAIPCDAAGQVDLDALPSTLRNAYLGARARVGRDYLYPTVQPIPQHELAPSFEACSPARPGWH